MPRPLRILLAAAAGVGVTYFDSLTLGLWWDDYAALRPWSWSDVGRAFHGTWDPWQIWPMFYRPLTVAYYALAFHVFGLNAVALHAVSLAGLIVTAALLGLFVLRETQSIGLGIVTALLYGVHPAIAQSEGPWFFLQNHLLCSLIVVVTLLVWQQRRDRPTVRGWWPVLLLITIGAATKEDVLFLAPALVAVQALRARFTADLRRPTTALVVTTVALMLVLFGARHVLLGEIGGPTVPRGVGFLLNVVRGPIRTLAVFQQEDWTVNQLASAAASLPLAAGLWILARRPMRRERSLVLTGGLLLVCFNIPLVLASSASRFHLVALSAVVVLAGCLGAVGTRLAGLARYGAVVVIVAVFALASRAVVAPFRPCAPENLWTDSEVETWTPVPAALRAWLAHKAEACARGEYQPLTDSIDVVVWPRGGTGLVSLINASATEAIVELRAVGGAPASSQTVRIDVNGGPDRLEAVSSEWRALRVALSPSLGSRLRRMHRLNVTLDAAPASVSLEFRDVHGRR